MHTAEMRDPRASMTQMLLMISILEMRPTPRVEQKSTRALVMMEDPAALAAVRTASCRSAPYCSSSRKRVVIRMA